MFLHADLTATDTRQEFPGFQSFRLGVRKHAARFNRRQPVAVFVGKIEAVSFGTVALDEGTGSEIFQTRPRTGERLTSAFGSGTRVLETVTRVILEIIYISHIRSTIDPTIKIFLFFEH